MGSTECFSENLYEEDINPGMKHGMALFEAVTKPVLSDQQIDITVLNVQKILDLLEDMASDPFAATIPAPLAMNVAVLDLANNADHRKCFYQHVVSSMIQKKINNHTTTESWRRLELQKEKFEWTKADDSKVVNGPTL
eukprot:12558548-Ditylum_brightwellii.AAC.1